MSAVDLRELVLKAHQDKQRVGAVEQAMAVIEKGGIVRFEALSESREDLVSVIHKVPRLINTTLIQAIKSDTINLYRYEKVPDYDNFYKQVEVTSTVYVVEVHLATERFFGRFVECFEQLKSNAKRKAK